MKNIFAAGPMACAVMFFMAAGAPLQAVTLQGDITANILTSLSLTKLDALDFGNILPGSQASVIRIAPHSGLRTRDSGNAVLITGGTENDGTFSLDGEDGLVVNVDVPDNVSVENGPYSMSVSNFTWTYNGGGASAGDGALTLLTGGAAVLSIGADLAVDAQQPFGAYVGTYDVTVNYQ